MNDIMNCHKYHHNKKIKKTLINNVFLHEPSSIIVFYDHKEEVRILEKSSSSFLSTFKNSTFLKRKIYC
jgi:hypothetical protein